MITFFSIMFVLIGINAILLFFSVNTNSKRAANKNRKSEEIQSTKIYPLNIIEPKLKKAI